MKLHLPSLGDILRLFFTSADVSSIVANVHRQVAALDAAVLHHRKKAAAHRTVAETLEDGAKDARGKAGIADYEASRATRVADKLTALIA